jgi:hypothetical protein
LTHTKDPLEIVIQRRNNGIYRVSSPEYGDDTTTDSLAGALDWAAGSLYPGCRPLLISYEVVL